MFYSRKGPSINFLGPGKRRFPGPGGSPAGYPARKVYVYVVFSPLKNGVRNRCPYRRCGVDTEIPYRLPFWRHFSAGFCMFVCIPGSILNFRIGSVSSIGGLIAATLFAATIADSQIKGRVAPVPLESENSRRLWLSEVPCWKGFPANFDAARR